MLTSEYTARIIEQKARTIIDLLKRGVKFTQKQLDVMNILEKLRQKKTILGPILALM